jgi:predicted metalloprotease with PDZ domain
MAPGSLVLSVDATLPIAGSDFRMDSTRPADIPELDSLGWAGLVSRLTVSDAAGRKLDVVRTGKSRWKLEQPVTGTIRLEYDVDYSILGKRGWPAPREAAYADSNARVLVGRSLFLTTPAVRASEVTFALPPGWNAVTSWRTRGSHFDVPSPAELVENLCVLTRTPADEVAAGEFRLHVVALGHWQSTRAEVRNVLGPVVRRYVKTMGLEERVHYVVVLLPQRERGGESYRQGFALTVDESSTRPEWANLVAHEIFHLWNGWRLHGEDYPTSQWFQEGFTEYAANAALVRSELVSPAEFLDKLSSHLQNYRKIKTTLEAGGTSKGPPLYGGGALVAFSWDVMIRNTSKGKRTLRDFWLELLHRTEDGSRGYAWKDLRDALEATAPGEWDGYYQAHVRGDEPQPLGDVLPLVGLRVGRGEDGSERIEEDPAATSGSRALWRELITRD